MGKKMYSNKQNNKFSIDLNRFPKYFESLKHSKSDFVLRKDGTSLIIECNDKQWKFMSYKGITGKGFHLCIPVRADIENFIKDNPNYLDLNNNVSPTIDLEVQKANMNALKKYEGEQIYNIDICNCYWETAHKMGFISLKTYTTGLKNKEWKTGRNASIGALAKVTTVSNYINGELIGSEIEKTGLNLSIIRNNVVNKVHEAFLGVLKELGNEWLMYFTDCVYVPFSKRGVVKEYFERLGYETKESTYQLDNVNLETGMVNWYDYQKSAAKGFAFAERQKTLEPYNIVTGNIKEQNFKFDKDSVKLNDNQDFLKQ